MRKSLRRTPRNYDGTELTSHKVSELLPAILAEVGEIYSDRPDLILAAWKDLIGPQLAPMTEATAFKDGQLFVRVSNSTLYSLLSQQEKYKLLQQLKQKFPKTDIRNIIFRIG